MFDRLSNNLPVTFEGNVALVDRERFPRLSIRVESGAESRVVRFDGHGASVSPDATDMADVTLTATQAAWNNFAERVPAAGYQSLNGMLRAGHLEARGDMLEFGRHLLLIEQVFARVRGPLPARAPAARVGRPLVEAIIGRYLRLDIAGRPHRIYYEEAGPAGAEAIPLLCLHTAGSDSRQYRAVLNDPTITARFRVIAFDLPWHGKSSPPPGYEHETYRLTTALYIETVMAVVDALALERPAVMGCSIGGRVVLHLALQHPNAFRAAIGLQSAMIAQPGRDAVLRDLGVIWRPDVHGGIASAAYVDCLMSPTAPSEERWETLWHYAQSGPGVFAGDLNYYVADGNLTNATVAPLRDGACPVYLLTGEYDLSATPARTAELADLIKPREFRIMKGVGHFPMSKSATILDLLAPYARQDRGQRLSGSGDHASATVHFLCLSIDPDDPD